MQDKYIQAHLPLKLPPTNNANIRKSRVISDNDNALKTEDRAFHDWYRFVLSFPPHLVRDYFFDFGLDKKSVVLDPFCGTGTTIVEAKKNEIRSIGLEANPFPYFASIIKTKWDVNPIALLNIAQQVSEDTYRELLTQGIDDRALTIDRGVKLQTLDEKAMRVLIKNSISPLPLHKTIILLKHINTHSNSPFHGNLVVALGNALVSKISNLRFGPEVGVGKIKNDIPVVGIWMNEIKKMADDLKSIHGSEFPNAEVIMADAREISKSIKPDQIDAIITSPPYPNEKDYTRTTRLESVVLGFFKDMMHLRGYKKNLLRSNTRGVYKADDDDLWISDIPEIQHLAKTIEERRIKLGKTSGFEKLYARVTKLYFGGMARHFSELTNILKPGAKLAYVVGDQASYLRVMIRTGQLLASIAEKTGYRVVRIDLFRKRFATATQEELREEVVILEWPG